MALGFFVRLRDVGVEVVDLVHFVACYGLVRLELLLHVGELGYVALVEVEAVTFNEGRARFGALESSLLPLRDLSQLGQALLNFEVHGVSLLVDRALLIQVHLAQLFDVEVQLALRDQVVSESRNVLHLPHDLLFEGQAGCLTPLDRVVIRQFLVSRPFVSGEHEGLGADVLRSRCAHCSVTPEGSL